MSRPFHLPSSRVRIGLRRRGGGAAGQAQAAALVVAAVEQEEQPGQGGGCMGQLPLPVLERERVRASARVNRTDRAAKVSISTRPRRARRRPAQSTSRERSVPRPSSPAEIQTWI